jgi:hypothetical protein
MSYEDIECPECHHSVECHREEDNYGYKHCNEMVYTTDEHKRFCQCDKSKKRVRFEALEALIESKDAEIERLSERLDYVEKWKADDPHKPYFL